MPFRRQESYDLIKYNLCILQAAHFYVLGNYLLPGLVAEPKATCQVTLRPIS